MTVNLPAAVDGDPVRAFRGHEAPVNGVELGEGEL
jgi:hypothetical protein